MDILGSDYSDHQKSDFQIMLIKSITFSLFLILTLCFIIYQIQIVIGEYTTILGFSFISSIILKPIRNHLSYKIINLLTSDYINDGYSFLSDSIIKFLILLILRPIQSIKKIMNKIKFFNTQYFMSHQEFFLTIIILYIMVFKLNRNFCQTLISLIIFIDFAVRISIDISHTIIKKVGFLDRFYHSFQDKMKKMQDTIQYIITLFLIITFIILIIGFIFLIIGCVAYDGSKFMLKAQNHYTELKNKIDVDELRNNQYVIQAFEQLQVQVDNNLSQHLLKSDIEQAKKLVNYLKENFLQNEQKNEEKKILLQGPKDHLDKILLYEKECLTNYDYQIEVFPFNELLFIFCKITAYTIQYGIDIQQYAFPMLDQLQNLGVKFIAFVVEDLFFQFLTISQSALKGILNFLFFILSLLAFMSSRDDFLSDSIKSMPIDHLSKKVLIDSIQKSLEGSFYSSIKISINHIMMTWLYFNILEIEFNYIAAFLAGFLSFVPLIDPSILMIPVIINQYMNNQLVVGIVTAVIYYILSCKIYTDVYQQQINIPVYWMGLSVTLGYVTFDLKGIFYGPLLFCISNTVWDLIVHYQVQGQNNQQLRSKKKLSI